MKELIILFGLHYLSDFLLQSKEVRKMKATNVAAFLEHTFIIFIIFFLGGLFVFPNEPTAITFAGCVAVIHGMQDVIVWRGYKNTIKIRLMNMFSNKYELTSTVKTELEDYKYWEDRWFYDTIGLDQVLHYVTIILLYNWLV